MTTVPLRHMATVWTSSVDKHTVDGEMPVQLCNYTDAYKNDRVRPGPDLMRATATPEEIQRNRLRVGDTVFTKDSEDPWDIGISAYVDGEANDFVCGYHLAIARPSEVTHPRFLTWSLRSRPVLDHFANHASGISRYGISLAGLRSAPIPLSAIEDQRRIADFLDDRVSRIDGIIAARQEQLTAQDEEFDSWWAAEFDRLAEAYPMAPIRRLLESIVDGPFGSSLTSQHYVDEGTRVIRLGNIGKATFRDDDRSFISNEYGRELATHAAVPGDLVMAGLGDEKWPLGRYTVVPNIGPAIVKADCYRLRLAPTVSHHFAAIMLTSPSARSRFALVARGSTRARLNTAVAREALLPLAPMDVQMHAVRNWEQRHFEVERLRKGILRSIDLLTEYRFSLITAAVKGELDVTTASFNTPG